MPCARCGAPLCHQCAPSPEAHLAECELIRASGVTIDLGDLSQTHILYAVILPLRMWVTRVQRPEVWTRLNFLQGDTSEAHKQKPIWREVADYLHNTLGIKDLSLEEIVRLSGLKVKNKLDHLYLMRVSYILNYSLVICDG